jgi:hypothetical protein
MPVVRNPASLADLRARRDALDAEIREAEEREVEAWNTALDKCEDALVAWLRERGTEYGRDDRKNITTWDVGHGALTAEFGMDGTQWSRSLRLVSGRTLTLEWSEVPEPERFLAIVAVLLGEKR